MQPKQKPLYEFCLRLVLYINCCCLYFECIKKHEIAFWKYKRYFILCKLRNLMTLSITLFPEIVCVCMGVLLLRWSTFIWYLEMHSSFILIPVPLKALVMCTFVHAFGLTVVLSFWLLPNLSGDLCWMIDETWLTLLGEVFWTLIFGNKEIEKMRQIRNYHFAAFGNNVGQINAENSCPFWMLTFFKSKSLLSLAALYCKKSLSYFCEELLLFCFLLLLPTWVNNTLQVFPQ